MFCLTHLCILLFKNWKINTLSSKSMQTEKAKSSRFDRTRGDKKQIFPTLMIFQISSNDPSKNIQQSFHNPLYDPLYEPLMTLLKETGENPLSITPIGTFIFMCLVVCVEVQCLDWMCITVHWDSKLSVPVDCLTKVPCSREH